MAFRKTLEKRLYNQIIKDQSRQSPFIFPSSQTTKTNFHRELLSSPEKSSSTTDAGFFRRFLQQRKINQSSIKSLPELFNFPVGEKLRKKLNISGSERLWLEGLRPPATERTPDPADTIGISVEEVRKILKCSQLQRMKSALQEIPMNSITYSEFLTVCRNVCTNDDQALEFAKMLDQTGDIIVLGNIVFLHPDQVAKSMEKLISQSIAIPNDQRKQQLEELENQKTLIDGKAVSQVRSELYCGLGFLVVQTSTFMRLTFWELSWDVMEPICFFVTSFYFVLAYMFFLRTSKEPTFEGYFERRFKVKQRKLMEVYNFDRKKYIELYEAFYPNSQSKLPGTMSFQDSSHRGNSTMTFGKIPC